MPDVFNVTGDMWGQSWNNILDVTIPYPGKNFLDVTTEMVQQVSSSDHTVSLTCNGSLKGTSDTVRQPAEVHICIVLCVSDKLHVTDRVSFLTDCEGSRNS